MAGTAGGGGSTGLEFCSVSRLSGSIIFAMEKVRFRQGSVGEVTLSGGKLVGVSVAIVLPVENGCMVNL